MRKFMSALLVSAALMTGSSAGAAGNPYYVYTYYVNGYHYVYIYRAGGTGAQGQSVTPAKLQQLFD